MVCLTGSVHAKTIYVFLIGGQSNADGRGNISGATDNLPTQLANPQTDVPIYYATSAPSPSGGNYPFSRTGVLTTLRPGQTHFTDKFGPELSFGRSMADFYKATGHSIALIKYAVGGTSQAVDWKAGGNATKTGDGGSYLNFHTVVANGLAALRAANPGATLVISGMIWMQGEGDTSATYSADYQANLTDFIADIRLTYGASLPFVLGQLSVNQTYIDEAYLNAVRDAQSAVAAADPRNAMVVTDTFGMNSDNLHFNRPGQVAFGSAFAAKMRLLVPKPQIELPPPPTVVGKTRIRTKNWRVTVRGTIEDKKYSVQYRLGAKGGFRPAKALNGARWKVITSRLKFGRNVLSLRTMDPDSELTSRLKRVIIKRRR